MNEVENYDELSIADIVRRVWKGCWLVLAGLVAGIAVGWVATDGGSASSTSRQLDLTFVDYSGTAEALGLPPDVVEPPLPSAETGRASQVASDLDLTGARVSVTAIDTQGTLRVVVTGDSDDAVTTGATQFVDAYRAAVVGDLTAGLDVVGEFATAEAEMLTERRDDLVADLGDDSNAAVESELLVLNERITDASSQVRAAERVAGLISDRLLAETNATTSTSSAERSSRLVLAGGVLGALAVVAALAALTIVDRRVRRRQQVSRLLPGVPLLAVLGRGPVADDPQTAVFQAALAHRLVAVDADHVDIHAVGGGAPATRVDGVPTTGSAAAALLVCAWGKATEDQLSGAAQALALAGRPLAGVVLVDVPERDRSWASAGFATPDVVAEGPPR